MKITPRSLIPLFVLILLALGAVGVASAQNFSQIAGTIRTAVSGQSASETEITGTITSITPESWTVDGTEFSVVPQTEVKDAFVVGDVVKVHLFTAADGSLTAREVEYAQANIANDNSNDNGEIDDDNDTANSNDNSEIDGDNDNANSNDNGEIDGDNGNANSNDNSEIDDDNGNANSNDHEEIDDDNGNTNSNDHEEIDEDHGNSNSNENANTNDNHSDDDNGGNNDSRHGRDDSGGGHHGGDDSGGGGGHEGGDD
jgi:uncharacterized membrane protein YgcG